MQRLNLEDVERAAEILRTLADAARASGDLHFAVRLDEIAEEVITASPYHS